MRHYTWNGSGGLSTVDKPEVIPGLGNLPDTPIGSGMQPKDYDKSNNLNPSYSAAKQGFSKEKVMLTNNSEVRNIANEVRRGDRVAMLMPGTGKRT